jgi:hypothetical protein
LLKYKDCEWEVSNLSKIPASVQNRNFMTMALLDGSLARILKVLDYVRILGSNLCKVVDGRRADVFFALISVTGAADLSALSVYEQRCSGNARLQQHARSQ